MAYKYILKDVHKNTPVIMGILNVTPDSFSDGGKFTDTKTAIEQAWKMYKAGALIIDIGGESSRPGAKPVTLAEELRRVTPILKALVRKRKTNRIPYLSIDTYKPEVAAIALQLGADLVNDISGLRDPLMRKVVAKEQCPVILMHMQGIPGNMQKRPVYKNVVQDIITYFKQQITLAQQAGINPQQIILDPGIGFGKTVQHNVQILKNISIIKKAFPKLPLLIGASRKSFIDTISKSPLNSHLAGTLTVHNFSLQEGADILRVHDVPEHIQMIRTMNKFSNV